MDESKSYITIGDVTYYTTKKLMRLIYLSCGYTRLNFIREKKGYYLAKPYDSRPLGQKTEALKELKWKLSALHKI